MKNESPTRLSGVIKTNWGYELIWATNENYCGKILVFEKAGLKSSMFFHREKDKTWFINSGRFAVRWIDPTDGILYSQELKEGDVWHNPPLRPHQLEALDDNSSITEVSTADSVEDTYKIIPEDAPSSS